MMTKKDFTAIAVALKEAKPADGARHETMTAGMLSQWRRDVEKIADVLFMENPRFDLTRFYQACGRE